MLPRLDSLFGETRLVYPNAKPETFQIKKQNSITKDLVAAYTMQSPGVLIDHVGIHHGSVSGNPTVVVGKNGNAINFDAAGDFYTIPDHDDLDFGANDDMTIVLLTKPGSINQDAELIEKQTGNPLYQILSQNEGNGNNYWFTVRDSGGTLINAKSSTVVAADTWQHVACRRDAGTNIQIMIDAVQEDSTTDTTGSWANTIDLKIGSGTSGDYDGIIDHVYIWRRRLGDHEIISLYHDAFQIFEPVPGIVPFVVPSGGANHEVSASFGKTLTITQLAAGAFAGSATFLKTLAKSQSTQAAMAASNSFNVILTQAQSGQASMAGQTSLNLILTKAQSAAAAMVGSLALNYILTQSQSGQASMAASINLNNVLTLSQTSVVSIDVSISLNIVNTMSQSARASLNGAVSENIIRALINSSQAAMNSQAAFTENLAVSIAATAAMAAGLTLSHVKSMTTTGSISSIVAVTPDKRIFTVSAEIRTLTIESEDRTLEIQADPRTKDIN